MSIHLPSEIIEGIEQATLNDVAEISHLQKVFRKTPDIPIKFDDPDWISERINDFRVIRDSNGIAGLICISLYNDHVKIDALNIRYDRVREGIGTALLNYAVCVAKDRKLPLIRAGSAPRFNAKDFYLKHEFNLDTELSHLYAFEFFKVIDTS